MTDYFMYYIYSSLHVPVHVYVKDYNVTAHSLIHVLFALLFACRLADLMDQHKEELATLESVDSGAVYTLALKTHVGFSIDTFRYFAGWCDKIQGSTIPINNARPNSNLCLTKREPIGSVIKTS